MRQRAPSYVADFDSAAAMLRATASFLAGQDYPAVGQSRAMTPLARSVNLLPRSAQEGVYALGGLGEAIAPDDLGSVSAEEMAEWVVQRYPERRYPAVMIGSSNGAAVHLCAALGIPWLPQTFLIPVRHMGSNPDDPQQALEFGRQHGAKLLEANPELQLHHMHDANQDRLMVRFMDYFRVKRLRLGAAYERFLRQRLAPGGTILVLECERRWPTMRIGERHVFQHGALGGATEDEFLHGSQRVEEYLERYDAPVRRWPSPEPDGDSPEAEWGFEPALRGDFERFAHRFDHPVERLVFDEPEHLSPLVADLYRWWYGERGLKANRLLGESFFIMEPYWALRTGSVPFWMKFNMEPSADCIERYLDQRAAFDEIYLMLFNHGVEAVGLATIERWRGVLERARSLGRFVGVGEDLFPRDFGSFARYHREVQDIPARYPLPGPLALESVFALMARDGGRYAVQRRSVLHGAATGG